jgi:hypothetical protein
MSRRQGIAFATTAKQIANMVKTRTNHLNQETHTLIADWLIDSGCTVHMTPYSHDFTSNMEPHHTLVETANGGLVEVEEKGTEKLLIMTLSTTTTKQRFISTMSSTYRN